LHNVLKSIEQVMDVAAVKLLAVTKKVTCMSWSSENVAALYGCILALHFHNNRQLAEQVVRSHMGTVYSISEDREFVWWGYPSEPILPASILYARKNWLKEYGYEKQLDELLKIPQSSNHVKILTLVRHGGIGVSWGAGFTIVAFGSVMHVPSLSLLDLRIPVLSL
jgi:hypothetical protein